MLSEHTGDRSDRHLCKVGSGGGEKEQTLLAANRLNRSRKPLSVSYHSLRLDLVQFSTARFTSTAPSSPNLHKIGCQFHLLFQLLIIQLTSDSALVTKGLL